MEGATIASSAAKTYPTNLELAASLHEAADLLESQGASMFRVRAHRNAARTVEALQAPLWHTSEVEGTPGLTRFPAIGRSIAETLGHLIRTGKFPLLDRLRGDDAAEHLFATVADIGPKLAQRIHEQLGIETLWELDVDRQYRELAKKQQLPRIAPRRFNPTRDAWLPVLHTERASRHYTALFSNTARPHELAATHDWAVISRDDDGLATASVPQVIQQCLPNISSPPGANQ